jgi:SAM-dependent methyltransferase
VIDWDAPVNARRLTLFRSLLALFQPGRLVDLGSGHGRFAQEAAIQGWNVTAVDARNERWPYDPAIQWVQADVRTYDLSSYDLISCLGLFYHLTLDDQLALLTRSAGRPIIIDTHLDSGEGDVALSERVVVAGYEGRWYDEPDSLLSAWRNERSFWPTTESFRRMLNEHGYVVLTAYPPVLPDRCFYLGVPAASSR